MSPTHSERLDGVHCLVTDGQWRKSVSAIRSLGAAGARVSVLGDSLFTTGHWSRHAAHRLRAPGPAADAARFAAAVDAFLDRGPGGPRPLLLMEDATLLWAAAREPELRSRGGALLLPPAEALAIAQDKSKTADAARALGLDAPQTWVPSDAADLRAILRREAGRGLVVKPRTASGSAGVVYVDGRSPQPDWTAHQEAHGPLLVQERVPASGRALGVSLLFDADGICRASFAHERLRQYPVSGGPSTDRVSIAAPALVEQSVALLRSLHWRGVAMVEWKEDPATGRPRLLEINARFWGSLELAVRCGVDFPVLYAAAALGSPFAEVHRYEVGRRCRWVLPGELLRYLSEPRGRREGLRRFLSGLPRQAEEWNPADLQGTLACALCPALLVLQPRYWRYLRPR
jgi:predicted ATP-grasp superfamily ATP-dependent carboligase